MIHRKRFKAFLEFLRPPPPSENGSKVPDNTIVLSFDCEKNLQLLRVPDSAAYYSRNVYLYNFTIVQGYSNSKLSPDNVVAYCWTENEYLKNSNTIASCILCHLSTIDLSPYKHIRFVADGCAAQNKNSILVTALIKWFSDDAPNNIPNVELIFPVTGDSFLPPDRVFAQIECQVRKRDTIINPDDYLKIIGRFASVKKVGEEVPVLSIKAAMSQVMKSCLSWPFSISQVKRIQLRKDERKIKLKGEPFYEEDTAKFFSSYCKQGKKIQDLEFELIEPTNAISREKKEDLQKLVRKHFGEDWRSLERLKFFIYLIDVAIEDEELPEESCSPVEENSALIV